MTTPAAAIHNGTVRIPNSTKPVRIAMRHQNGSVEYRGHGRWFSAPDHIAQTFERFAEDVTADEIEAAHAEALADDFEWEASPAGMRAIANRPGDSPARRIARLRVEAATTHQHTDGDAPCPICRPAIDATYRLADDEHYDSLRDSVDPSLYPDDRP